MDQPDYPINVCHQTDDSHIHYHVRLITPPPPAANNQLTNMRELAKKIHSGNTAGGVITAIKAVSNIDDYGISYLAEESLPLYQQCHKGEETSPVLDWDQPLYDAPEIVSAPSIPQATPHVGKITH